MIELRVDDRLIHGQVALLWSKHLKIKGIIVANDAAATSKVQQASLKMAAPQGINVLIKSLDEASDILNDPRAGSMNILLLCKSVTDAYEMLKNVTSIDRINIANVGRFDGEELSTKHKLFSTLYLDNSDLESFKAIQKMSVKMVHQISPDSNERDLKGVNV
ncbi:PTS sugar transporter subunit IIB [Erysipelothrix urinaevulpis]|uniref:PTS system mannose/fructose/N-acetylgalactosamine-transporter subunit IIB n=1 Tax=Erysipelothrix urinaevulpis TaxID=2683717 RepID=UPI001358D1DC|nr:PTS sugar transporter subunit IIB [Erysipelothrix urinaevulpis]